MQRAMQSKSEDSEEEDEPQPIRRKLPQGVRLPTMPASNTESGTTAGTTEASKERKYL